MAILIHECICDRSMFSLRGVIFSFVFAELSFGFEVLLVVLCTKLHLAKGAAADKR